MIYFAVHPNKSWQIVARYDKYYKFYRKICKMLESCLPSGMVNLFPNDRWKTRIFGVNDEVRNARRNGLDLWFRELIINPRVILHDVLRKELYEFLEVEKHKAHLNSTENTLIDKEPTLNEIFAPRKRLVKSNEETPILNAQNAVRFFLIIKIIAIFYFFYFLIFHHNRIR